jgi:dihydroflavonol-4-reductase
MIAITGANGLLGNYITRLMVDEEQPVCALVRRGSNLELLKPIKEKLEFREADVVDLPSLLTALNGVQTVVHVAGMVSFNPRYRDKLFKVNVEGTRNVVNACLKLGVRKLVHISSVAALGRTKNSPEVNEESKWVVSQFNTHYAASKYEAELEVFRGMEEGLQVSFVNPSVILAPVRSGQSSAQLFTYVDRELGFYGDGNVNYVDVRDVAWITKKLIREDWNGEKFIASGGVISLKELLHQIAHRLGRKKPGIRIPASLAMVAAWVDEQRSGWMRTEPLLTRQSVKILQENFNFHNTKAIQKLGIQFKTLDDTLGWCCTQYRAGFE